jgi:uncharacterized protein (DUF1015 family)
MVATRGLVGLRPAPAHVGAVVAPPYDVIKPGTPLEAQLAGEPKSLFHVTLGDDPIAALENMKKQGWLVADEEPAYYVYEQTWGGQRRAGVFLAGEVSDYSERKIIRHEKTFDSKVKGRIALAEATKHTMEPIFLLTRAKLGPLLEEVMKEKPLYELTPDFGGRNDLHGVATHIFRVTEASPFGKKIQAILEPEALYIADGHHRYHAALRHGQTHFLGYVTENAKILAYDRVVRGKRSLSEVAKELQLEPTRDLATPDKHTFCLYTREGSWILRAKHVPDDVIGRLDCAILERELYGKLGLSHDLIVDPTYFDYYPESMLADMKAVVDRGDYDLAIALHPVSIDELMSVADAGLESSDIVMPEKSTFFAPKILSGLIVYRHEMRC